MTAIRERAQDLRKARDLLRQAEAENLSVELVTDGSGTPSSLVLAQQARKIGVTINVKQVDTATYGGPLKNSWSFSTGGTLGHPFLAAAIGNDGPYSQTNRSHLSRCRPPSATNHIVPG